MKLKRQFDLRKYLPCLALGLHVLSLLLGASMSAQAQQPAQSAPELPILAIYCEEDRPLQYYDENRKLVGFTVEIVQEIQKRLGNKEAIQVVPWSRGLDFLNSKPNTLLFSMARTPERSPLYQWIGPISSIDYGLYAKTDFPEKIRSFEDAKKIRLIGVYRNDIRDQTLTAMGFKNLDRASSSISSFKKLMIGRIPVYADSKMGVESLARAAGYQVSDVKRVFDLFKSHLYIAASKDTDARTITLWNRTLEEMKKDGTFARIQRKYLVE